MRLESAIKIHAVISNPIGKRKVSHTPLAGGRSVASSK
jgi:hypothetical protein